MALTCRILAVCGSLQARSGNRALLERARSSVAADVEITIFEDLRSLPPFDPDIGDAEVPDVVVAWRCAIGSSDAVLIASPEYGFSVPGVLKNAIDWVIGSGELENKVVGVTAAVKLEGRGQRGLDSLADPLRAVSARIVGGSSIVQGPAFDDEVTRLVEAMVAEARAPTKAPEHGLGRPRASALALEWVERVNRHDAVAIALLYAADASVSPLSGDTIKGRSAIQERYSAKLSSLETPLHVGYVFDGGSSALVEWRDATGARGCTSFSVKRWEITCQRDYAGPRTLGA